jgi:hypothetical protein
VGLEVGVEVIVGVTVGGEVGVLTGMSVARTVTVTVAVAGEAAGRLLQPCQNKELPPRNRTVTILPNLRLVRLFTLCSSPFLTFIVVDPGAKNNWSTSIQFGSCGAACMPGQAKR